MERTLKKNKFVLILLLALTFLLSVFSALIINFKPNVVLADAQEKQYRYEILEQNSSYKLLGYYKNSNEYYLMKENSDSVYELIELIEQDRVEGQTVNAVSINFGSLNIYNETIVFSNSEYTLSGELNFANLSGECFCVTGSAQVTMNNFTLSTVAKVPLMVVKETGATISLNNCSFASEYDCVFIQNGATATINNSILTSNQGVALSVNSANVQLNSTTIQTESETDSALQCEGEGEVVINSCTIKALNTTYAVLNVGTMQYYYGSTNIFSKANAIKTNVYFSTNYYGQGLNSCTINVLYTGELSGHDTLIVKDFDCNSGITCNLLNSGYQLRLNAGSLYIAKLFNVTYNANCLDNIEMPTDSQGYYDLSTYHIIYLDANVRANYTFIGYAFNKNATTADLTSEQTSTINGANVTLYAIWEPVNYSITMQGVNDGECQNASTYNYNEQVTINNPTRQFYTFSGWLINGQEQVQNLTLPYKNYTDITIEAKFVLTEFNIVYNNLTVEQVDNLGLQKTYNITSPSLNLTSQNYLIKGYSFYGLSDRAMSPIDDNVVVNFGVGQTNAIDFVLGQDLVINVNVKPYFNGQGNGTKNNPFILDSSEQFYSLLKGEKVQQSTTYIKLNSDLVLNDSINLEGEELFGFVIEGNKKAITVNALNYANSTYGLLPVLKSCTIKNLTLNGNIDLEINAQNSIKVGVLAPSATDCYFASVINNAKVNVTYCAQSDFSKTQISGFVCEAKNCIINNCSFAGYLLTYAQIPNKSVYLCGFTSSASNTLILNCSSTGSILYKQAQDSTLTGASVYACGFAVVNFGNLVANCINSCELNIEQKPDNQAVFAGILVAIRQGNQVVNCVSAGSYKSGTQNVSSSNQNIVATLVWSIFAGNQIENCVTNKGYSAVYEEYTVNNNCEVVVLEDEQVQKQDYNYICNQQLNSVNQAVANFMANSSNTQTVFGLGANTWGEGAEILPQSKLTIRIYNNINGDIKVYVFDVDSNKKIVVSDIYSGYLFDNFYYDKNYNTVASVTNINDNMVLYAKYITYKEYTLKQCVLPIVLVVVDIILLIAFIIYCERPRRVIYVLDGVEYDGDFVKWGKQIALRKDKLKYVWYKDSGAEKEVTSLKMPFVFGKYKLYAFSDKQGDAIKAMHKAQQKLVSKKGSSAKQNKVTAPKVKKATKKSKVQQEIENSGITIVKKEVKLPKKQDNI